MVGMLQRTRVKVCQAERNSAAAATDLERQLGILPAPGGDAEAAVAGDSSKGGTTTTMTELQRIRFHLPESKSAETC